MSLTFDLKEKTQNTGDCVEEWSDELEAYYDSDKIQHRILVTAFLDGIKVGTAVLEYYMYLDEHGDDVVMCENSMDEAYLETIYVKEEFRGNGIGTQLLMKCLEHCDSVCLRPSVVLAPDNLRAKAWYEEIGYDISSDSDWYVVDQGFGVYRVRLSDMRLK